GGRENGFRSPPFRSPRIRSLARLVRVPGGPHPWNAAPAGRGGLARAGAVFVRDSGGAALEPGPDRPARADLQGTRRHGGHYAPRTGARAHRRGGGRPAPNRGRGFVDLDLEAVRAAVANQRRARFAP